MADEKVESTPEQAPAGAPAEAPLKKKKPSDEEKYGGSGGKFDMGGGRGGPSRGGPGGGGRGGKGGKGFIDPGHP
jgi:hypothetical protein